SHDARGFGGVYGRGERLDQGRRRPRAPRNACIGPRLPQAWPARHPGWIWHVFREPTQAAQGQEPAHGATDERGGRARAEVQDLARAETSRARGVLLGFPRGPALPYVPLRFFLSILSALLSTAARAFAQGDRPMRLSAESALLLAPNGPVLFAKNPSEDHAPASLTKLMTLYLACEDLEAGRAQWEGMVAISRRAADTP